MTAILGNLHYSPSSGGILEQLYIVIDHQDSAFRFLLKDVHTGLRYRLKGSRKSHEGKSGRKGT